MTPDSSFWNEYEKTLWAKPGEGVPLSVARPVTVWRTPGEAPSVAGLLDTPEEEWGRNTDLLDCFPDGTRFELHNCTLDAPEPS